MAGQSGSLGCPLAFAGRKGCGHVFFSVVFDWSRAVIV